MADLKPRVCHVIQGSNGYGFHLHGEKGKTGQRVRKVEPDSPAEHAGLLFGDRIIAVNGINVETVDHKAVVARIKEKSGETNLLVISEEGYNFYKDKNISITEELIKNGENVGADEHSQVTEVTELDSSVNKEELRPRLCKLTRTAAGFGFNLHSEKGKQGRYIRSIDSDSAADIAGLKAGDRIIEINGANIEGNKHSEVVSAIKDSGEMVEMLVVDSKADDYFKSVSVTPTSQHVSGPLPTKSTSAASPSKSKDVPPTSNGSSGDLTTSTSDSNLLEMDLQMLKAKSQGSRKKKAPSSNWNNRQAMFNNL